MSAPARPVSVIIPAHNEEAVIGRCLRRLLAGAEDGELEVVVVCNGCSDSTAKVAREAAPQATIIEIPVASKVAALNAGDERANYFPRFYVDADVELPISSLRLTAQALSRPGVLCAAPSPSFALDGRPWAVRAFYEVFQRTPYLVEGMVGTGVYALSDEGRRRFDAFPDLTADDQFVHQQFDRSQRSSVPGAHFVVHTPYKLGGLLRMRVRAYRGNLELARSGSARVAPPPTGLRRALVLCLRPSFAPAAIVYLSVNLAARALARQAAPKRWERDESARSRTVPDGAGNGARSRSPGEGTAPVCYVTSHYPKLSHTFVMREVQGVRAAGLPVETVSVHRAAPAQLLAAADHDEAGRTWNILPIDAPAFFRAHAAAFASHPVAYARTLGRAVVAAPPGARGRTRQLFYFGEAVPLWRHAKKLGATHLHAHLANVAADVCWLASELGKLAAPRQGWRWSFTMHGPTELYSVERFNLRRKVASADGVICISEHTRAQLMYLSEPASWPKLAVVHCGADLARYVFVPPADNEALKVLCVARFVPEKGLDLLLEAVAALCERRTDVRLVLVGEGPLEAHLRRKATELGIQDRVAFTGPVGQDDLAQYYAEADVFCLPSFAEGLPVVLMEAMATGRPVVASRIAGIPELVEDGVSGLLVAPGQQDELVAALEMLAASPELRRRMGGAGRARVEDAFDARRNAAQVAAVLRRLAPQCT